VKSDRRSRRETSVALHTTLQGMECHHSSCAEHIRVCLCFAVALVVAVAVVVTKCNGVMQS
jgi:hypothetical protein